MLWRVLQPLVGPVFYAAVLLLTGAIAILGAAVFAVTVGIVTILNALIWAWNNLIPFSIDVEYIEIPTLAEGGRILSEGAAYLHPGETVVPAQVAALGSGNGMVIDNTIMLDGNVLYQGMQRVNRQQEMRRTGSSVGTRAWRNG